MDALDIEHQLFKQHLERLLLRAHVSEPDVQSFIVEGTRQGPETWHTVQSTLGPSYSVYLQIMINLSEVLKELYSVLSIKENGEVSGLDSGKW
jgi:hypothetical protein